MRQELGEPVRVCEGVAVEAQRQDDLLEQEELQDQTAEVDEDVATGYKPFGGSSDHTNVFADIDPQGPGPEWPTNTGPALDTFNLPPQSIYATLQRREQADRTTWSTKKLKTVEASTEKLLYKLFHALQIGGRTVEAAEVVPKDFAQLFLQPADDLEQQYHDVRERLNIIKMMDRPDLESRAFDEAVARECGPEHLRKQICLFGQDGVGAHLSTTRWLNQALQHLFRQHHSNDISTPVLLAKMAYNISLSPAPPNIETYSTLLLGLSKAHLQSLIKAAIISMQESHIRPNEVSLAFTLDHFTATGNETEFFRHLSRVRGQFGGLCLARRDLEITEQNKTRLVRHHEDPDKIIQLPYPTPYVFTSIIAGLVKFSGLDHALTVCESMRHEGWGLSMASLTPLLNDCADRGDWEAGQAIWAKVMELRAASTFPKGVVKGPSISEKIGMETFAAKLRLCLKVRNREVFDDLWDFALRVHHLEGTARRLMEMIKAPRGTPNVLARETTPKVSETPTAAVAEEIQTEPVPDPPVRPERKRDPTEIYAPNRRSRIATNPQHATSHRTPWVGAAPKPIPQYSEFAFIREEELLGNLPAGSELDDYELSERPIDAHD